MSEIQHDPTPWFFGHYIGTDDNCYVGSEEGNMRIIGAGRMLGEANAAYIVNCVNSHASLVEENKRMREALELAAEALDLASGEVEGWGAYASEYFQEKHDLPGCVKEVVDAANAARKALGDTNA